MSNSTPTPWQAGLLALGLLVGCGGSASRHEPDSRPPNSVGGEESDPPVTAGAHSTGGGVVAPAGGNGTSTGGAPSGGSSQGLGGSAGTDVTPTPVVTLPPGCRPRAPMETASICSLAVDCDTSPSLRTYCHQLESGQWECQCTDEDRMFRLENAAGIQACALTAQLCADDALELGDESCEPTSEDSAQDSCAVDLTCMRPVELDATLDAQAWLLRSGSVHCSRQATSESFYCACANGTLSSNYELLAESGEVACGPFADFCMSGATPVFGAPEVCAASYFDSDSEGCQRSAGCGGQMALTEGVSLAQFRQRFARCTPRDGGGSECSCSNDDTAFSFYLSAAPDDASCESSLSNCDPNALIEATAPATCEPLGFDADGDACSAALSCVQPATVDDRSLEAQGTLFLMCRRLEADMPWSCSCASDRETTKFELGAAGASATAACNQASTACLERLGLHLGPYHDPIGAPDPFE